MIKETRKTIITAFQRLISKHDFDNISVDMILNEAHVSRSTFYRYFNDKYDVMNANYKDLLDYYISSQNCHNYRELFYYLFKTAKDNWQHMQKAFTSTGINSFSSYISQYSYDTALAITRSNRNGNGFTEAESLQVDLFCSGVSDMYRNWISGKYDLSAKEAAEALYEIMPKSLRDYWWT